VARQESVAGIRVATQQHVIRMNSMVRCGQVRRRGALYASVEQVKVQAGTVVRKRQQPRRSRRRQQMACAAYGAGAVRWGSHGAG